jgi:hypothetical protein
VNRSQLSILENRIVNEIPGGDGFWRSSTEEAYIQAGTFLVDRGFTLMETLELLSTLYGATAEEFGG